MSGGPPGGGGRGGGGGGGGSGSLLQPDLSTLLKCPVCLDIFTGHIYQCTYGHNICASHIQGPRPQLRICPTCRAPYSSGCSRNVFAENMLELYQQQQQRQVPRPMTSTTTPTTITTTGPQNMNSSSRSGISSGSGSGGGSGGGNGNGGGSGSGIGGGSSSGSGGGSSSGSGGGNGNDGNSGSGGGNGSGNGGNSGSGGGSGSVGSGINNLNLNSVIECKYMTDGCVYQGTQANHTRQHEENCHYRPITCCLKTDGCNNAQIPFFDYISHLTGLHGVKLLQGSHHSNRYLVKSDHKKLVRDGSSSVFMLEVANQVFIVRAIEVGGWVHVWVAFHGHPAHGKMHKAEIQFNYQYDDDSEPNRPRNLNLNRNIRPGPSNQDDEDDIFSGHVVATSRQTWEQVQASNNYLSMEVPNVEYNLKRVTEPGRTFSTDTWAVTVTITRDQRQN